MSPDDGGLPLSMGANICTDSTSRSQLTAGGKISRLAGFFAGGAACPSPTATVSIRPRIIHRMNDIVQPSLHVLFHCEFPIDGDGRLLNHGFPGVLARP